MIAVIFEVVPAEGRRQEYLDLAASLRPELEKVDGFISVERFESLYTPGKLLSLQFWRDEESVQRWRTNGKHRAMQEHGRDTVFADYRLRVASVLRDYGPFDRREQAPDDSRAWHERGKADRAA
ncbi:MAG TPA: antibiotic biosynthesis monooxygenase [Burkholderiaceae bacterium]|jgi:heme-degrading monooxygenase HmoA|nr:antibiotic biosynthesis monooxygenase [Burkholderiaceae bacterium]